MNEVLTIEQAEYSGGYTLVLLFSNGEKREFDFSSLLDKGVCRKMRDMYYFKNFKIDGFSVDWNNEIGFAPEFLYENSAALGNQYSIQSEPLALNMCKSVQIYGL